VGAAVAVKDQEARFIRELDVSIVAFNQDGRLGRERATKRAKRVTGRDWTYTALLILEELKQNAALRMTELAVLAGTTAPTVTQLVRDLQVQGLVDKIPDEQDGRASIVSLTAEGRQVAEDIGGARVEALTQAMAGWSGEDLERFVGLFERLQAAMRRMG
jgi:DNA-binding MarR family transcriptional regulator